MNDLSTWDLAAQAAQLKAAQLKAEQLKEAQLDHFGAPFLEQLNREPAVEEGIPLNDSKFPALIELGSTLVILDHHELPIGKSFRILETAPLTTANVLAACLEWSEARVRDTVDNVRMFEKRTRNLQ